MFKELLVCVASVALVKAFPASSGGGSTSSSGPAPASNAPDARQRCELFKLDGAAGQDVSLFLHEYVPANSNINFTSPAGTIATNSLPAFCRESQILVARTSGLIPEPRADLSPLFKALV